MTHVPSPPPPYKNSTEAMADIALEAVIIKNKEIEELKSELAALKSLPKEPSEKEIEKAMEDLIPLADRNDDTLSVCDMLDIDSDQTERRIGFNIAITWLSSYKLKQ